MRPKNNQHRKNNYYKALIGTISAAHAVLEDFQDKTIRSEETLLDIRRTH